MTNKLQFTPDELQDETTTDPLELDESENEEGEKIKESDRTHTVRHKDGGMINITEYTKQRAIAVMCSECCGFESNPMQCPIKECPLYPYRKSTTLNRSRFNKNETDTESTEPETTEKAV